jgi:hypothetical protein
MAEQYLPPPGSLQQGYNPFDAEKEKDFNGAGKQNNREHDSGAFYDSLHYPAPAAVVGGVETGAVLISIAAGNADKSESTTSAYESQSFKLPEVMAPIESSWHFLGELPYRRFTLYDKVDWNDIPRSFAAKVLKQRQGKKNDNEFDNEHASSEKENLVLRGNGLAAYPPQFLSAVELLDVDLRAYLETTTATQVVGCPHGGALAMVSKPKHAVSAGGSKNFATTYIRVTTSSGRFLSLIPFPPPSLQPSSSDADDSLITVPRYSAADLFQIGFTSRTTLIALLRDSTCLTYKVSGEALLPPFKIIQKGPTPTTPVEVIDAHVYSGGVAILTATMACALVELLDEFDDPAYVDQASLTTRKIVGGFTSISENDSQVMDGGLNGAPPPNFALVTLLPTSQYAV